MRRRVACSYLAAVERHRDGELGQTAAAEFEAHLASCPICQEEQKSLERLAALLQSGDADGAVPKVKHERLKSALLERCSQTLPDAGVGASSSSVSPSRIARRRRLTVGESAVVGLTLVIIGAILFPVFFQAREKARRFASGDGVISAALPGPRAMVAEKGVMNAQSPIIDGHPKLGFYGGWLSAKSVAASRRPAHALGGAVATEPGPDATAVAKANQPRDSADSRPDRYLIKDATVTLEVKDARQASRTLAGAVSMARGYVSDTHESVDELGQRSVTTKVRVPSTRFDASMQRIEALGKVLEKQVTAEDVTEEFTDSQAKLRNLKRTEQRLLAHLDQTGRLPDILLVEKEVTRVRGEIEQLEGRLRFLEHRIAFSTIDLTLNEAARAQPVVPAPSYSSGKQASDALRSLVGFLQVIWSAAIWMAIWAVVWFPIGLGIWLVYRRRRDPFLL